MIYGIGVDLVKIGRIKDTILRFGDKFKNRILTLEELAFAKNIENNSFKFFSFLAKRFAAKEAYAKACGFGIGSKVRFHDIIVLNDENGKPYIEYDGGLLNENDRIHLSISDTDEYAIAYVVIER